MNEMDERSQLTNEFANFFKEGGQFASIVEARRFAADVVGVEIHPATPAAKMLDEAIELGLVLTARTWVQQSITPQEAFDVLVDLYDRQPNLTTRTSTSVLQQAYSTPLPLAYLAGVMAGIDAGKTVYEPTAGNGALLLLADPAQAIVNELNPDRANALRSQGFSVSEQNATEFRPSDWVDIVITNPPFGSVRDANGQTQWFRDGPLRTTQIDHVIALNALKSLKEDGRAVLILGGKLGDDETRAERYNTQLSRGFYRYLYKDAGFQVTDHFSVHGDLYRRQGAGFPIDFILIEGRGTTTLKLPAVEVPRQYKTFDELKEVLAHYEHTVIADGRRLQPVLQRNDLDTATLSQLQPARGRGNLVDDHCLSPLADNDRGQGEVLLSSWQASGVSSSDSAERLFSNGLDGSSARTGSTLATSRDRSTPPDQREFGIRGNELGGRTEYPAMSRNQSGLLPTTRSLSSVDGVPRVEPDPQPEHFERPIPLRLASLNGRRFEQVSEVLEQLQPPAEEESVSNTGVYQPRSQARSLGTLIPIAAEAALSKVFDKIEAVTGQSVDNYVCDRLREASQESLFRHYAAEQIDSIALAIYNHEHEGTATLIGHDTGVGKGRIVCALAQYAQNQGLTPVILTADPVLFTDLIGRDAVKTETQGVFDKPLFTANNLKLQLADENGEVLREFRTRPNHAETISRLAAHRSIEDHTCVLTTYSQFQGAISGERRELLKAIAPESFLILDESHKAGGASGLERPKTKAEIEAEEKGDRISSVSKFFQELVKEASGFVASSATAIKDPIVASRLFYDTTQLKHAASSQEEFAATLQDGGVPLQQMAFSMWTESGGCIRFEKSYEGIEFNRLAVPVDLDSAEKNTQILNLIWQFDKIKNLAVGDLDEKLAAEGEKAQLKDSTIGDAGATSTNFTSIMHNLISVVSTAQKVDALANQVIADIETGRKPVVTLFNTGESVIDGFIEGHNSVADIWNAEHPNEPMNRIEVGDSVACNAGELFMRYLEKSRLVKVAAPYLNEQGRQVRQERRLANDELGSVGVAAYEKARSAIQDADWNHIPLSPIDYFKQRIEDAGYSVGEITGRSSVLRYESADDISTGALTYEKRENKPAQRRQVMDDFNNGDLDCIITNATTGYSIHASRDFADQRQRVMYIAQPQLDINQVEQNFGRIHRSGQVNPAMDTPDGMDDQGNPLWGKMPGQFGLPVFKLVVGEGLPTEERAAAVLMKKMAHLKANTTGNREGSLASDMPDFINHYGNTVAVRLMESNPDLHAQLDHPLGKDEELHPEKAIQKVTGRIPMLISSDAPTTEVPHPSLAKQASVYQQLTTDYKELMEQKKALGENDLEAQKLDLKAKPVQSTVLNPGSASIDSPFTKPSYLVEVTAKTGRKPNTSLQALNKVQGSLGMSPSPEFDLDQVDAARQRGEEVTQEKIAALKQKTQDFLDNYRQSSQEKITAAADKVAKYQEQLTTQSEIKQTLQQELDSAESEQAKKPIYATLAKQDAQIKKLQGQLQKATNQQTGLETKQEKDVAMATRQLAFVTETLEAFPIGQPVSLVNGKGYLINGVVENIRDTGRGHNNPACPGNWKLDLCVVDAQRDLSIRLDELTGKDTISILPRETVNSYSPPFDKVSIYELFDERQADTEETRYVVSGQILGSQLSGRFAQITDNQSNVHPVYLLPRGFDPDKDIDKKPIPLNTASDVNQFLENTRGQGKVGTLDEKLVVCASRNEIAGIDLITPKSTQKGGRYFTDPNLLSLTGDFTSTTYRGDPVMLASVSAGRKMDVLDYLAENHKLAAFDHKDVAKAVLGIPAQTWTPTDVINPDFKPITFADSDLDGLTDTEEVMAGTNPLQVDSDEVRDSETLEETDPLSPELNTPHTLQLEKEELSTPAISEAAKGESGALVVDENVTANLTAHVPEPEKYSPTLGELRNWQLDAALLERPYEKRIKQLGSELLRGTEQASLSRKQRDLEFRNPEFSISEKAYQAMQRDAIESAQIRTPMREDLIQWFQAAKASGQNTDHIQEIGKAQIQGTEQESKPSRERDGRFKNPDFVLSREDFSAMRQAIQVEQEKSLHSASQAFQGG